MTILTEKDLGKFFTENDGKSKGQLFDLYYCVTRKMNRVRLLYPGGEVDEPLTVFKKYYKLTTGYPPIGTICECTQAYSPNKVSMRYSDGKGSYSLTKDFTLLCDEKHFSEIKPLKLC